MPMKKTPVSLLQLCIFILAVAARLLPGARTIDDAYITFRYARNIVAGNGFVYNPGERVLGTTTPLYTLLLSLLGLPFGGERAPFPEMALLVNALADGLACLVLFDIARRLGYPWAGAGVALVWAITPYSVTFAIGGLETSLYVLLLGAIGWLYLQGKFVACAFTGSLLLMTRPDALIFLGPLVLDRLWVTIKGDKPSLVRNPARIEQSGRAIPAFGWWEAGALLFPYLLWAVFAILYFGSPLPHSITAKTMAYRLPEMNALQRLLQHYATPFLDDATFGINAIKMGIFLYPILAVLGIRLATRRNPRCWPFFVFPWLYFLAFVIANPLIFRWYLTPPLPAYQLAILIAVEHLLKQGFGWGEHSTQSLARWRLAGAPLAMSALVAVLLLFSINGWTWRPDHAQMRPAPRMSWIALELLYRQAADLVNKDFPPSGVPPLLAAGDVGVLGYYTSARILDTVGLNSPQSVHYYPLDPSMYAINYAVPPDLIMDYNPDAVVTLEVYGRLGLLADPRFTQVYHLAHTLDTEIYGSQGMLIFLRNK